MSSNTENFLKNSLIGILRAHIIYILAYSTLIVVYNAWQLITPPSALIRWWIVTIMTMSIYFVYWNIARAKIIDYSKYFYSIIAIDIAMASLNVYFQRGMASKAVALFFIPIIVAVFLGKKALFITAGLCSVFYFASAQLYFILNYNEGFRVELIGEVAFYCVMFFVASYLLSILSKNKT